MNGITLKQLRYFESLAIAGHFGRAAEMSGVTQPALSVQIKDLETSLGAPLFERGPRQIRLTAFGQTVRGRCREILRSVDELGDLARAAQDGPAGQLRLGVIPTIAPYLLPRMIQNLGAAFPDLDLRLRESVTPTLVRELADGQLDAAILALPISEPNLRELPLFEESFSWSGLNETHISQCLVLKVSAQCGCCCLKKGTAFAIRPCRFAICKAPRRVK